VAILSAQLRRRIPRAQSAGVFDSLFERKETAKTNSPQRMEPQGMQVA
jgi:hypothetical protein